MIKTIWQKRYVLILFILFIGLPIGVRAEVAFEQKGVVGTSYEVRFEGTKAMLSRDGSEAQPVADKTTITKPGTYYLNIWDSNNQQQMVSFTIKPAREKSTYIIKKKEDLEEAFRDILGNYKTEAKIQMEYGRFTMEQLNDFLFEMLEEAMAKYPMLTFEQYEIRSRSGSKPLVEMTIKYPADISLLKKHEASALQTMVQVVRSKLSPKQVDYEREWIIYDWLVKRTSYSTQVVNGIAPPLTHTIQGTLNNKVAVCDGYAKTLMYMLNMVGVPTDLVVGDGIDLNGNRQAHAWNLVKIQNQYYHVDATWGDVEDAQLGFYYNYFNENDNYMGQTHTWNTANYPKATSVDYSFINMPFELPGVYKVDTSATWDKTLKQIKKDKCAEGTIIFYATDIMKWDEKRILTDVMNGLRSSLKYQVESKYNTKIISYKLAK